MYTRYIKRLLDFLLSIVAIAALSPLLLILAVIGTIVMKGNPFFTQLRPGKDERIFRMIKFRTMTNESDNEGKLLPDEYRLTKYGTFLRSTSLDELPELFNILIGDMSFVGPRPQLVRDMVFMTPQQRQRHAVRAGLTGLAQVNGRNNLSWEQKFVYDLEYIQEVSLKNDIRILWKTVGKVLRRNGITEEGAATAEDFGDYLLRKGAVTQELYDRLQNEANELLKV